jgi:DNA-binding NtrC family response regulator
MERMTLTADVQRIKVLVLDDEADFLNLCREFLARDGDLEADYVASPREAMELMASREYHAVVSDHDLPGMDGMQFLRALRSMNMRIPFIMITGHGREGLAIEALQNGADFYMEKAGSPASMFEQLLRTLKAVTCLKRKASECLQDPFRVYSEVGVLLVSNGGERVMAASAR